MRIPHPRDRRLPSKRGRQWQGSVCSVAQTPRGMTGLHPAQKTFGFFFVSCFSCDGTEGFPAVL